MTLNGTSRKIVLAHCFIDTHKDRCIAFGTCYNT